MQFSILTVFTLVAVAVASPHRHIHDVAKRDVVNGAVAANAPAMTDKDGNIVPFDSKKVYQDAKVKGL